MTGKAIHHRKAQTSAPAQILGREEWLGGPLQRRFVHPATGVRDPDNNVIARFKPQYVAGRDKLGMRRDPELPALRHRIARIDGEI